MNTEKYLVVLFSMATVLALLAACGAPQPTATVVPTSAPPAIPTDTRPAPAEAGAGITVTFDGDQCAYRGPDEIPAGRLAVILDVEDQVDHSAYGLAVVTLDEGKTFEDLDTWPSIDKPPWAHLLGVLEEIRQGSRAEMTVDASEKPLFLVCFTAYPVTKSGVLGPIEIEPAVEADEAASPEPAAAGESDDATWNLVVLGDSLVAEGYSVLPEAYAAALEEDLGVDVEIQNLAVGGESTASLLANVKKYPWYQDPIQEAEGILISVGGGDLPRMEDRFFGGDCGGADNQNCLRQQLEESQANWDALLAEIASLTGPRETLIRPIIPRVLAYYARAYKDQPGDVQVYNSYVVALYEHMARSCAERRMPVLDLYALYDGPNADPSLPEIAGTGDGVHVSDEGDAVIAGLLCELGYAPINP